MSFCVWLLSFSVMFLKVYPWYSMYQYFILFFFFVFDWVKFPCKDTPHLFIYFSVEHSNCFHFWLLWIIMLWIFVYKVLLGCGFSSSRYISSGGIAWSYENSVFNILRNCQTFLQWLHDFTFPPVYVKGFPFLHILIIHQHLMFFLFFIFWNYALLTAMK